MPKQKLKAGLLSTLCGAAGGGTRMRKGHQWSFIITKQWRWNLRFWTSYWRQNPELIDPNDPRKKGVLQRWYKAVSPLLKVIMERVAI
jgi:hypothetical protein